MIAEVLAAPEADAPRLAYGDWLRERGDPRGEMIALQFRRHRGRMSSQERARERWLLAAYSQVWLGGLDRPCVTPIAYERGFVSEVAVSSLPDELLDEPDWATVQRLSLHSIARPAELARLLLRMPSLRELRRVQHHQLAAIGRMPVALPIERVDLDFCPPEPRYMPDLRALPSLAALRHVHCQTSAAWLVGSDLLPRLRVLEVSGFPEFHSAWLGDVLRGGRALERLEIRNYGFELRFTGAPGALRHLGLGPGRGPFEDSSRLERFLAAIPEDQLETYHVDPGAPRELGESAGPHLSRQIKLHRVAPG
jgi:uncharacterized protein (TIGR02996 family)